MFLVSEDEEIGQTGRARWPSPFPESENGGIKTCSAQSHCHSLPRGNAVMQAQFGGAGTDHNPNIRLKMQTQELGILGKTESLSLGNLWTDKELRHVKHSPNQN